MLKRITIRNFKGFKSLTFDLTAADYSYNPNLVKDGIVNKALVYGKNGSGKTSLGFAIFDLVRHLTDKRPFNSPNAIEYYQNLDNRSVPVFFEYVFSFDYKTVVYAYEKSDLYNLNYEKLLVDDKTVLDYHYDYDAPRQFVASELKGQLNTELPDNKLSILKYIYKNSITGALPEYFTQMMHFCENMLWFRSLLGGNDYCGLTNWEGTLDKMLYDNGNLSEFQKFLAKNELHYDLGFEVDDGDPKLYAYFNNRQSKARFNYIASSGTQALWLLFNWMALAKDKLSLLFIDEFDAFYHFETAANIMKLLNEKRSFQSILTTHNTYLMQNAFTRPDCCFLLNGSSIKSLKKSTDRELREAHNLEKMYINGAFTE